jgi:hypothetical protein
MPPEEKLTERIILSGSLGVKKTDLRKEFAGEDIDRILEDIITRGEIYIDKKGAAYYCWHRDYYLQSLLNSDARFRLIYEAIKSLEQSVNRTSDALAKTVEANTDDVITALSKLNKTEVDSQILEKSLSADLAIQLDQFKNEFDSSVSNYSNSIGWVELAKVRNELCTKYNISDDEFYHLVEQLINNYEKYELSTGGDEGITIRGLLHGFVRCI